MAFILCLFTGAFAQTRQLTTTPFNKRHLRWRPDGNAIACTDAITGYKHINVIEIKTVSDNK